MSIVYWRTILASATFAATIAGQPSTPQLPASESVFVVKPYLQLGDLPKLTPSESVRVLWQAADEDDVKWTVEFRQADDEVWRPAVGTNGRLIRATAALPAYRLFSVALTRLRPGRAFEYRVSRNGEPVFSARGLARTPASEPYRFVVTGDTGADTEQERRIVHQIYRADPAFFAIAGDIVYSTGRQGEYRQKFFPVYNADVASAETGAPLTRSRLSFGAYGNHDAGTGDLSRDPDGQAYFLNWALPLNGPYGQNGLPNTPAVKGDAEPLRQHLTSIRPHYPRMANYSFDYGNAHWTFLDSNVYVDWSDAYLRNWLARDLALAVDATWKFVVFHHAPFNSSRAHFTEQHMRLVSDILEHRGVDVVFNGHIHNYQRSHPLRFLARPALDRSFRAAPSYVIDGDFTIDKSFDGATDTTPDGVLYIVTGAGGAGAYDPDQTENSPTWQPFTAKLIGDVYSITVADVDSERLILRQVSEYGEELDRLTITKAGAKGQTTPGTPRRP
jgi:hypothetical protein